jgi:hypothetical protein
MYSKDFWVCLLTVEYFCARLMKQIVPDLKETMDGCTISIGTRAGSSKP